MSVDLDEDDDLPLASLPRFVAGPPVNGHASYVEMRTERERAKDAAATGLLIVGPRRVGKTTYANALLRSTTAGADDTSGLAVRFSFALAGAVAGPRAGEARTSAHASPPPPEALCSQFARRVAEVASVPEPVLESKELGESLLRWLRALPVASMVILIDEVPVEDLAGETPGISDILRALTALRLEPDPRFKMIFAANGASVTAARREFSDLDAWTVKLTGLQLHQIRALAGLAARSRPVVRYTNSALEEVEAITGGATMLVQLALMRLDEQAKLGSVLVLDDRAVRADFDDLLDMASGALAAMWDGLLPVERLVLAALAANPGVPPQFAVRSAYPFYWTKDLEDATQRLVDIRLISPAGAIRARLWSEWLRGYPPAKVEALADAIVPSAFLQLEALPPLPKPEHLPILRQVLRENPNALRARDHGATVLRGLGYSEAAEWLTNARRERPPHHDEARHAAYLELDIALLEDGPAREPALRALVADQRWLTDAVRLWLETLAEGWAARSFSPDATDTAFRVAADVRVDAQEVRAALLRRLARLEAPPASAVQALSEAESTGQWPIIRLLVNASVVLLLVLALLASWRGNENLRGTIEEMLLVAVGRQAQQLQEAWGVELNEQDRRELIQDLYRTESTPLAPSCVADYGVHHYNLVGPSTVDKPASRAKIILLQRPMNVQPLNDIVLAASSWGLSIASPETRCFGFDRGGSLDSERKVTTAVVEQATGADSRVRRVTIGGPQWRDAADGFQRIGCITTYQTERPRPEGSRHDVFTFTLLQAPWGQAPEKAFAAKFPGVDVPWRFFLGTVQEPTGNVALLTSRQLHTQEMAGEFRRRVWPAEYLTQMKECGALPSSNSDPVCELPPEADRLAIGALIREVSAARPEMEWLRQLDPMEGGIAHWFAPAELPRDYTVSQQECEQADRNPDLNIVINLLQTPPATLAAPRTPEPVSP